MYGSDNVGTSTSTITKTQTFTGSTPPTVYTLPGGGTVAISNATIFDETGASTTSYAEGKKYFQTFNLNVTGQDIEISANTFPGTFSNIGAPSWGKTNNFSELLEAAA